MVGSPLFCRKSGRLVGPVQNDDAGRLLDAGDGDGDGHDDLLVATQPSARIVYGPITAVRHLLHERAPGRRAAT